MPRKNRIVSPEFPYHITARCINRDWFRLPIREVWSIFEDSLRLLKYGFNFKLYSFVLMPNHFHGIFRTPDANLSQGMQYFMTMVSKEITFQSTRINQTFGGPFHSSLLTSPQYFFNTYKYIYRNPVEADLCKLVQQYPYSTLNGLLGQKHITIPLEQDDLLFNGPPEETLAWLNTPFPKTAMIDIQKELRRREFRLPRNSKSGRKTEIFIALR